MRRLQEAVEEALAHGYQLSPEALERLRGLGGKLDPVGVVKAALKRGPSSSLLRIEEIDGVVELEAKPREEPAKDARSYAGQIEAELQIIDSGSSQEPSSVGLEGYTKLFRSRLERLMKIVGERMDSGKIRPIAKLDGPRQGEVVKVAGLVSERKARKGRVELTLEDSTGTIKVVAVEHEAIRVAEEVLPDELVIADIERLKGGVGIARALYHPDLPERGFSVSKKKAYVVFLSDIHVGSKAFLADAFNRLIRWLWGELGDEEIVKKIKYLIIAGDLVDGVGVYPGQERELEELSVYRQYEYVAKLLSRMPKEVEIIIGPGNHDPVRQALPQPPIPKKYARGLLRWRIYTWLGTQLGFVYTV